MRRALPCVPRLAVLCSALLLATGADTGSNGSEALSFLKAAEQGVATTQYDLGLLYDNDHGLQPVTPGTGGRSLLPTAPLPSQSGQLSTSCPPLVLTMPF